LRNVCRLCKCANAVAARAQRCTGYKRVYGRHCVTIQCMHLIHHSIARGKYNLSFGGKLYLCVNSKHVTYITTTRNKVLGFSR
jgi:hypothetical protein